ncbi:MAG: hypothetical protein Q4E99_05085, partial [Bacillota bacterium]|nr:hypothetical protein [Bacillota bacterium]
MKKLLAILLTICMVLGFTACSKKQPSNEIQGSTQEQTSTSAIQQDDSLEDTVVDLYDPKFYADFDAYEKLEEIEIVADNKEESNFVLSEANRIVQDFYYQASGISSNAKSDSFVLSDAYKKYGVFKIDIGAAGLNDGANIYRIEYGLRPVNEVDLLAPGMDIVYDGKY